MNRRKILGLLGGTLLGAPADRDSRSLVATPAKRAEYLHRLLKALCTDIGARPAGSKAFDAGAGIIRREMERAMPEVASDPFTFKGWESAGDFVLRIGDRQVETYIAENSPGTLPDGLRGSLQRSKDSGFEIVQRGSAGLMARVGVSEFGRAIATLHSGKDETPLFNVGKQDVNLLERAVADGAEAWVKGEVKWIPEARTTNVSGTIAGESKEEILIVAHADTKYNTPGANDNTASMICMLMMAHSLSAGRPPRTMTFLATTGEERGYIGAKHYAVTREQKGTLGDIKICINLDSLTYGPNLQIATTDRELAQMILDIHRELDIRSQPKVLHQNDTMDSAPFLAAGARTVHLNSRGDDARTLPLWHRPEDRADTIKPEFIGDSFRVLVELCARLQTARS